MTARRNLIFCAMGPGPGTVKFAPELDASGRDIRTWDLVEVLWHPEMIKAHTVDAYETVADQVFYETDRNLRKFACLAKLWTHLHYAGESYDAVLVADDDLTPHGCTWSDVFALFHETRLHVAQAALTRDSTRVWSWPVTHQDRSHAGRPDMGLAKEYGLSRWRTTDFVEVMMPIFSREAIGKAIPYFADEPYGLGLETWWHHEYAAKGGLGVLDATPVRHTRPLGSAHSMTGNAKHPFAVAEEFRRRHGFPNVFKEDTCWTLARWGKDDRGRTIQIPPLPPPIDRSRRRISPPSHPF
jgi:Protein of unknown function (DUF707)